MAHAKKISLNAVISLDGENKDFTEATPSGVFEMVVKKGFRAADFFDPGHEYILEISPAPKKL
jgi:hypothetical protein